MPRLETMSRFAEPDEVKPVKICVHCDNELHAGEWVVEFDFETFCDIQCFAEYMGAVEKTLEG